jgi:O-antigen/teichoic acid export membrane protein
LLCTTIFYGLNKITLQEWALLSILCWLNAANSIHLHLLLARQQLHFFNGLAVFMPLAVVIFLLIFFTTGHLSKIYYLYSLLLAWGLSFFLGLLLFTKPHGNVKEASALMHLIKEGFRYGITNQASHLTGLLNNRLIFFILPAGLLGIYSNALSLAEASMMIPSSLGQVMYASLLNEKNPGKSARMAILNWWFTLLLLAAILIAVLLVPDAFYQLIFGKAFTGVKSYLIYLCIAIVFYGGYLVCSYWQSANGWFIKNFYATLAGLGINAVLSLLFYLSGTYTIHTGILALGAGFFVLFLVSIFQFGAKNGGIKQLFPIPNRLEIVHFIKK